MTPRFFLLLALSIPLSLRADPLSREVLAEINLARTQPQHYAELIAASGGDAGDAAEAVAFLRRAHPLAPLTWSPGIERAARAHALDVGPRGASGHTGSRGTTPWSRMAQYGQWQGRAGENIDYGHGDPRAIVTALIVDRGVPGRGHRANLFNRQFGVAGIAVAPHAAWGTMCVMDFAGAFFEIGDRPPAERGLGSGSPVYSGRSFF